eukprot:8355566-Alexandrium_andersonii.AAC.1
MEIPNPLSKAGVEQARSREIANCLSWLSPRSGSTAWKQLPEARRSPNRARPAPTPLATSNRSGGHRGPTQEGQQRLQRFEAFAT